MKTREEEIRERAYDYAEEMTNKGMSLECEWIATSDGFLAGAKWADENPKNPWRDVGKELPPKLNKFFSDFVLVAYPTKNGEYRFAIDRYDFEWEEFSSYEHAKFWMPIPELQKGGEKC